MPTSTPLLGTLANPARVDPTGTTPQPVTGPLTDAQLRATSVPVDTGLVQPTTPADTQTVAVLGTVPVTGPLTDAQLRAVPVPVSGTVAVSGTVPVSATTLPLPSGASTEATLALIKAKTDNLDVALSTRAVTGLTDTQLRASAVPVSGTVAVSGTVPVSAAALPLPSGASTEATLTLIKAKTDNLDVALSTRAVTGLTDTQLRASAVPVSGTVTANVGTTNGLALDATLTGGTQKAIVRAGAKGATAAADVTSTAEGADHQAMDVQIMHGGAAKDPTQIRALTSGDVVTVNGLVSTLPPSPADGSSIPPSLMRNGAMRVHDVGRQVSAFGVPLSAEITPVTQQHFAYGIHPRMTRTRLSSGATAAGSGQAGSGSDLLLNIDNAANAFAIARSFRALHYRPGLGQIALFTAAFNAGVANSQQFAGAWSPGSGYFVGYSGTTWGAFARTGGSQEIRTLTVSTAATAGGNVTITLDGTAVVVAVTNQTGNPSRTAWEIAQGVYSAAGSAGTWGWDAYARGAVVYFVARRARVNVGAFTFAAGATGSAAAFATVRSGVAEVDDFGSPATPGNWTWIDALDGTGPSGLNLNKQKSIIYGISFGHLGHRGARVFVMHPVTGLLVLVAEYRYMGTQTFNVLNNPTVFVGWGLVANGSTTAMAMTAGSGMGGIEGALDPEEGEDFVVSSAKTGVSATEVPILVVRNGPTAGFGGQTERVSRIQTHMHSMTLGVNGGAAGTSWVDVRLLLNPTINNLANFSKVDATRLGLEVWADSSIATAAVTGGVEVGPSMRIPPGMSVVVPLNLVLDEADVVAVVCTPQVNGNALNVSLAGTEIQ